MKKLILLLFFLPFWALGQDCGKLKKSRDEFRKTISWDAPSIKLGYGYIFASKMLFEESNNQFIGLTFLVNRLSPDYDTKGIFVKFADGTVYKEENTKIACSYNSSGWWEFSALITFNESNKSSFLSKKIVKYQIGFQEYEMKEKNAGKILANLSCLDKAN